MGLVWARSDMEIGWANGGQGGKHYGEILVAEFSQVCVVDFVCFHVFLNKSRSERIGNFLSITTKTILKNQLGHITMKSYFFK